MANHLSALKRARQTERRTARNRGNTSRLRSALRDMREALTKGDKSAATQTFSQTASALDMQPGERLQWQLLNRSDLRLIRLDAPQSEKPHKK